MEESAGAERLDEQAVAEIRAGLARILASDAFSAAPQLSAFLAFIVERAVEGRSAELKGYTIAVEALGRPPEFDPQSDPIVRVEAGRLRRALTQYYAGEGLDDPLRITMPVGGYAPVFTFTESPPAEPDARPEPEPAPVPHENTLAADRVAARRWPTAALLTLAGGLLALLTWYLATPPAGPREEAAQPVAAEPARERNADAPQLVTLAIVTPQADADPANAALLRRVSDILVDVIARFDDLVVVKVPAPGAPAPDNVDYAFEVSITGTDKTLEGFGRLRSVRDGRIVWAASASRAEPAADQDLAALARRLATRLAEPFGIIQADSRQNLPSPTMECLYRALDYQRGMTENGLAGSLSCLDKLIAQDSSFYPAWAYLSALNLGLYTSDATSEPGAVLDTALAAALKAQRLAPSGGRAREAMMAALFLRGATEDALHTGREALERNPYDPQIMADLGSIYVRLNRPAEGLPLLERAIALSPGRPLWYDFYAYLAAYLLDTRTAAETYGAVLGTDETPPGLLGRALLAARAGDEARKQAALRQLESRAPLFGRDPSQYFSRRGYAPALSRRILDDLGAARP